MLPCIGCGAEYLVQENTFDLFSAKQNSKSGYRPSMESCTPNTATASACFHAAILRHLGSRHMGPREAPAEFFPQKLMLP